MIIPRRGWISQRGALDAAAVSPPSWTWKSAPAINNEAFGSVTSDFNSVAVNNPSSSDVVIVMVSSSFRQVSGIDIGGNAMTKVVGSASTTNSQDCAIWKYTGSVLTTPNIRVTAAAGLQYVGISVGYFQNVNSTAAASGATAVSAGANPQLGPTITVPAGGIAVTMINVGNGTSITWNNGTEESSVQSATDFQFESGRYAVAGSYQPSLDTGGFDGPHIATAAFGA